jgi:hypothetical protein
MKRPAIIKTVVLAVSIAASLSSPVTSCADELFKVSRSAVYQAVQNQSLKDTLAQVSQRSGIVFKIDTELGKDVVRQSIAAKDWISAVKSLLSEYNYMLVTEGKSIKTVIVTGHAGSGSSASHVLASAEPAEFQDLIMLAPTTKPLPKAYKDFPAGSVMAVNIPVKAIMELGKGKAARFDLPIGQFNVAHDNTVNEADGSRTWVGHLADEGQGYRVFMSEGAGGTMGHITTPEGTFNLESSGGSMYLVDTSKLNHLGFAGDTGVTLAATAMTNNDLAPKANNDPPLSAVTPVSAVNSTVKPVLDIMVLYTTQNFTAAYAKQRLAYLVTASNQAYTDSGINLTLRMVYAEPTSYTDKDVNGTALDNLASDSGVFAGIAEKRALYGADLVYLFRPLNAITQTTCGTTYLEMADGQAADKRLGYGTISDGHSQDSMASTYCGINTFTHEIGHSLGLVHDRQNADAAGAYPYAYAWGVAGSFGTIMSYEIPVVMYFSTPALATQCSGQPCGYDETDTARSSDQVKTVNFTAPLIANFMPTTMATPIIK